jgi:hypothetical protein
MEELECETNNLRHRNSELLLFNAKLEAENTMLKERAVFLEKVVLNKRQNEVDSYITTDQSNSPSQQNTSAYQSPF